MGDLQIQNGGYLRVTWKPIAGRRATRADLLDALGFPSDEAVETAVTTMPRWMWEGINEHVVNPEEVVRFVLQVVADAPTVQRRRSKE